MATFQVPPEAILFKATEESVAAIGYWIQREHRGAVIEQIDTMIGPRLSVNMGDYAFQVPAGHLVMKDQSNGLYSAISLAEYRMKYQ